MKFGIVTTLLLVLSLTTAHSQHITNAIRELKSKTLVVVLESTTKANLKRLDEDGKAAYEKSVANYNRKLKDVIASEWKFNAKIEYKTWSEINELINTNANEYLVFYAGNYSSTNSNMYDVMLQQGLDYSTQIFAQSDERTYKWSYTAFKLSKLKDVKQSKAIITRTIANLWPLKEDIFFVTQYMQSLLTESEKRNSQMDADKVAGYYVEQLKASTLLIKQNFKNSNLLDADIKLSYPYPFSVVDHDSLLSLILTKGPFVYIEIVPQLVATGEAQRLGYEHVLMNAATGNIVSYIPVNTTVLHFTAGHGYHHKYISKGIFEKYLSINRAIPEKIDCEKE